MTQLQFVRIRRQRWASLMGAILIAAMMIGDARAFSESPTLPLSHSSAQAEGTAEAVGSNCSDGELRVGDLKLLDTEWQVQSPQLEQIAKAWEQDAFLTGVRVGCGILEPGFRWQGTYYSPSAQAFFLTDTAALRGADFDPKDAVELPNTFTFGAIWRTLTKAGFGDEIILNPSTGITIQVNSKATPFGPGSVPPNAIVCHVALEYLGEIRDLFITLPDGTVFRHTFP